MRATFDAGSEIVSTLCDRSANAAAGHGGLRGARLVLVALAFGTGSLNGAYEMAWRLDGRKSESPGPCTSGAPQRQRNQLTVVGSSPTWGATTFLAQHQPPVLSTAALVAHLD